MKKKGESKMRLCDKRVAMTPLLLLLFGNSSLKAADASVVYADESPGTIAVATMGDFQPVDLDGDGDLDFVVAGGFTHVSVAMNNGGLFTETTIQGDYSGTAVAVGDWNGDGTSDFCVCGIAIFPNNDATVLSVFLNDNGSNFSDIELVSRNGFLDFENVECFDVETADMNNDGHDDLVALLNFDRIAGGIAILQNDGTGTFSSRMISSRESFDSISVGDMDGDGHADVVLVSRLGGFVICYQNGENNNSFAEVVVDAIAGAPRDVTLGDIDNDGDLDIVTVGDNSVVLYENLGGFNFEKKLIYHKQGGFTYRLEAASIVDANGDGLLDIVFSGQVQGILYRPQVSPKNFGCNAEFETLASGLAGIHQFVDVDGDGVLDVVAENSDGRQGRLLYVLASIQKEEEDVPTTPPSSETVSPPLQSSGFVRDSLGETDGVSSVAAGIQASGLLPFTTAAIAMLTHWLISSDNHN